MKFTFNLFLIITAITVITMPVFATSETVTTCPNGAKKWISKDKHELDHFKNNIHNHYCTKYKQHHSKNGENDHKNWDDNFQNNKNKTATTASPSTTQSIPPILKSESKNICTLSKSKKKIYITSKKHQQWHHNKRKHSHAGKIKQNGCGAWLASPHKKSWKTDHNNWNKKVSTPPDHSQPSTTISPPPLVDSRKIKLIIQPDHTIANISQIIPILEQGQAATVCKQLGEDQDQPITQYEFECKKAAKYKIQWQGITPSEIDHTLIKDLPPVDQTVYTVNITNTVKTITSENQNNKRKTKLSKNKTILTIRQIQGLTIDKIIPISKKKDKSCQFLERNKLNNILKYRCNKAEQYYVYWKVDNNGIYKFKLPPITQSEYFIAADYDDLQSNKIDLKPDLFLENISNDNLMNTKKRKIN